MQEYSEKYDASIQKDLDDADWNAVLPEVLKYAVERAKKFKWLGTYRMEPEELVQEAIVRAYGVGNDGGYRNWNKQDCPNLAKFLNGIIKSITSHEADHVVNFANEPIYNEGQSKDEKILKLDDTAEISKPKTPEEEFLEEENLRTFDDELDKLADGDVDLGMVILCIKDGIGEPRNIADETGLEIEKVYNLKRKLRRKLKKYQPKRKGQSSLERQEEWAMTERNV